MAVYAYKALDASGKELAGKIDAATEKVANQRLREQGMRPFELKMLADKAEGGGGSMFGGKKVKLADIATGVLEVVLDRLATFSEKDMELRTKIKSALTYPAIMGLVAISVVVFLLVFVIPTFTKMFGDVGLALPLPTQIVVGASNFLRDFWYICIAVIGGVIFSTFLTLFVVPCAYTLFAKLEKTKYQKIV